MSSRSLPFPDALLALGRPYAERAEEKDAWHDRTARALDATLLAPLRRGLQDIAGDGRRLVERVDALAPEWKRLPDAALRERAQSLRPLLRKQGFTRELAAAAFALVREAADRTIGQRHFETQLLGGYGLLRGRLVEMATGEGKTFCATLPACTVALSGYPVHVITVNDYLARRDAEKMGPLYAFLGLDVGVVVQGMKRPERRQAYACAITYATNKELAFDYLRDRVALRGQGSRLHQSVRRLGGRLGSEDGAVLRGLYYAIVDEADSVFVDEARTPLILSATGNDAEEAEHGRHALAFAQSLSQPRDFRCDEFEHAVQLADAGRHKLDAFSEELDGPWTSVRAREELLRQALSALHLFRRDQHYVVVDGKVQIVDESTGRVMPDRSWERGLHQLIELKEGVELTPRRDTLARLTYQRLFRRYVHLSGMTGTAAECAREIKSVYGLDTMRVPLHRPSRRVDGGFEVCRTMPQKWERVADVAQELAGRQRRPVLIGTRSVEASEQISAVLHARGLVHALLNAKQDRGEADVVSQAGQPGRITVATNMAGRGTDIELGPGVHERGGLHVILTEYHDSRRVDRQLVGRCARQGDPGSCQAIVSLEDDIYQVCAPTLAAWLDRLLAAGLRLPRAAWRLLRRSAQHAAEERQYAIRMSNLKHDRQLQNLLAFTGRSE
ncbi:MAG TPA: preprotein translocase subunit SecA [Ramlibacter sp.]|uniref:preprotein translocase subunit SecA n=1 Tax=Ramlibacter sp. TaxID=1917967 RepID=UPI002ED2A310